jgi:hypothetical protein
METLIDRTTEPSAVMLAKLPLRSILAYAAERARSVLAHIEIHKDDPEATVTKEEAGAVVALIERFASGKEVSEEEVVRALAVTDGLPTSVFLEEGVEAANVIWKATECLAAAVRREGIEAMAKHAAEAALVSDEFRDSETAIEEAWEEYDQLLASV